MRKFIRLLGATALLGILHGAASAEDRTCKFVEQGYGYYRIEQHDEVWTYILTASGPSWRSLPYGYHAPGTLTCEGCSAAGKGWGGLYHFRAEPGLRLVTAAERAERRKEWVGGTPYIRLGPEHIDYFDSREGVNLGPLAGYAVLYRFIAREGRNHVVDIHAAQNGGLLVIDLTDGCVSFETTIILAANGGRDPWAPLDSILREISIEKSRGMGTIPIPPAGAGNSAIVRPRR